MNIFYLSDNIEECAKHHVDKHVCKMLLEYAQILCTVNNKLGLQSEYKSTHENHPCVLWAGESLDNWLWLRDLAKQLNIEFKYRFNHIKNHKSFNVIQRLPIPYLDSKGITERPQCMPEVIQVPGDPVQAYRLYYLTEKKGLLKWSKRNIPEWVLGGYQAILGNDRT